MNEPSARTSVRARICQILGATLVMALTACATTPISSTQAVPVPSNRHLLYRHASAGTTPVLIKRDTGFTSVACATRIFVNGDLAALVRAGEKVTIHIPTGEVIFGAEPGGICFGGLIEQVAMLTSGKPMQYRIGYDHNGSISFNRTATK